MKDISVKCKMFYDLEKILEQMGCLERNLEFFFENM